MLKAARDALADGKPPRGPVQPENLLAELGVEPSENRDGVRLHRTCARARRTIDVFVEPVLPHPSFVILGGSPVALSLAAQARQLGYHVTVAAPATADLTDTPDADMLIDGFALERLREARRFVVVATQGKGDEAALRMAVKTDAAYRAFVGSRRKMAALREKLMGEGIDAVMLDRVKAPAGLDLGAIAPEEIAMWILAENTVDRRRGQRGASRSRRSSRAARWSAAVDGAKRQSAYRGTIRADDIETFDPRELYRAPPNEGRPVVQKSSNCHQRRK